MNRMGVPESEQQELLAYLKNNYRYENGGIVNRKTGRRRRGCRTSSGYLGFNFYFKGKCCHSYVHRVVWALCYDQLSSLTIDHINGDRLDNRIENLRVVSQSDNNLNTLLPWRPNKVTGVAGVKKHGCKYRSMIQGHEYSFCNPYEAFYWAIACGKRYRSLPPTPPKGEGSFERRRGNLTPALSQGEGAFKSAEVIKH